MKKLTFVLLAALLLGCAGSDPQPPQPPPPSPGPTPVVRDTDKCEAAQANLKRLECKDSRGRLMWKNADGEEFAETCRRAQEGGRIFLDPECIAESATCQGANTCPPSKQ